MNREQLRTDRNLLHVITDFQQQQHFSHASLTSMALNGGADMIQFRQKATPLRAFLHEANRALQAFRRWQHENEQLQDRLFLINDRMDVALAIGADGIHVGQTDMPVAYARQLIGPDRILGATATTSADCIRAEAEGADYIGFGPVFSTRSKSNPASIKGLDGLKEAADAVSIPVLAIAGITPERCKAVLQAGARGVAVMSAITSAADPQYATHLFRKTLDT